MPGGRTVPTLIAVLAIFGVAGVAAAAIAGKLPFVAHAFDRVASEVSSAVGATSSAASSPDSPAGPAPAGSGDAGAGDAGSKPRRQTAPLSSAQLGAPLVHGGFVTACGAPDTMKVTLKLDVRNGRAFNVRVKTHPSDPTVSACIAKAARDLRWDSSPRTGHVTVTY